jgi:toxin ParE1/3/4
VPYKIVWSDFALERITEISDFIAEEDPEAAKRVIDDLFRRVGVLAEQPRSGRRLSEGIDPDVRRLVIGSYLVLYRIQETQQVVTIAAVRHSRQRPLQQE